MDLKWLQAIDWGQVLTAVWLAAAALLIMLVIRWVARLAFPHGRSGAEETALRAVPHRLATKTRVLLLALVALFIGSLALDLPPRAEAVARAVAIVAILLQVGLWGSDLIVVAVGRYARRAGEEPAAPATLFALRFVSTLVLWSVVLVLALDNLGVEITALVAGLGIGGIAVALAAQSVLGDLFASLAIVFDRPFGVGDFIVVGDMLGTVEHVGIKTTRMRSLGGEELIFPNNDLVSSRIRNYRRMEERRVLFSLSLVYETSYEQLAKAPLTIREVIEAQADTRFDRAHFSSYGESALHFEAVYYVLSPDYNRYMDIQQAINLELFRRFNEDGVRFAFPTRTLHVYDRQMQAPTEVDDNDLRGPAAP